MPGAPKVDFVFTFATRPPVRYVRYGLVGP
jgi:hypothetical protein